jgi:hypothetical protein
MRITSVARGRPRGNGKQGLPFSPTLSGLGITKAESAQAQLLARIPDETFEAVRESKAMEPKYIFDVNNVGWGNCSKAQIVIQADGHQEPVGSAYRLLRASLKWGSRR